MNRRRIGLAGMVAVALCAPGAGAQVTLLGEDDEDLDHARARLASARTALVAGEVNTVGVVFDIDAGWHIYWDGLNDTGFPTRVTIDTPGADHVGWEVRDTVYPAPHRHVGPGGLLDHVYEGEVVLIVPIAVPADARPGTEVTLTGSAEWLVCKEACIPGWDEDLALTLPVVASASDAAPSSDSALFERSLAAVPVDINDARPAPTTQWTQGSLVVSAHDATRIAFFPGPGSSALADPVEGATVEGDRLILRPEAGPEDNPEEGGNTILTGVLEVQWRGGDAPKYYRFRSASHDPIAMPEG